MWKWENRKRIVVEPSAPNGIDMTGPEAIVLQKLLWYRTGDEVSDRQWRDVLGVLKVQGASLDLAYLERTAVILGLSELLARARSEAS